MIDDSRISIKVEKIHRTDMLTSKCSTVVSSADFPLLQHDEMKPCPRTHLSICIIDDKAIHHSYRNLFVCCPGGSLLGTEISCLHDDTASLTYSGKAFIHTWQSSATVRKRSRRMARQRRFSTIGARGKGKA